MASESAWSEGRIFPTWRTGGSPLLLGVSGAGEGIEKASYFGGLPHHRLPIRHSLIWVKQLLFSLAKPPGVIKLLR